MWIRRNTLNAVKTLLTDIFHQTSLVTKRLDEMSGSLAIDINIINKSNNPLPAYATEFSAGMDLCAFVESPVEILPGKRALIGTGLFLELPVNYEAQIRPRSGLALKNGITVLNAPGTIDSDYRGEIGIILINLGEDPFIVENGTRIAQMVISQHCSANLVNKTTLSSTERGAGGFGHTGTK